ncbi:MULTISPECIES: LLM class flavin-dependent oxidoreductase [unclassified Acinetobacter]|uniref:LLM class flavin-dependent oxidoreductase n=1 Tax=unclassified Acinetobacter TaxID=196816 RepID=UPI00124FBC98|nr:MULTISPECIES: LLM class flavin-dependent oxidoreductase [unclassified Acinetobacter]
MLQHNFNLSDHFKLGIFAANCSGGLTPSTLDDGWDASWSQNLKLAEMADEAGIDFMLSTARFIGHGGKKDFHGTVLETVTWTSALLAKTKNIQIFATLHTALNHPIVVAKQIATMAQVSDNRVGLNIVAGWNKPEYDAMGLKLPDDHETRYGYAQEWYELIKKTWQSTEPFNWDGKFFQTQGTYGNPNPQIFPPIFNAAGSKEGREFAVKNSDFLFTPASDLARSVTEIQELKKEAGHLGRNIKVLTFAHVICRPTEEQAKAEWDRQLNHADHDAVQNLIDTLFSFCKSFPADLREQLRQRIAVGHGGFPLVGTAEQVAAGLIQLQETGFSGCTLSFLNYTQEFPYFRDHVLPILKDKGLLNAHI